MDVADAEDIVNDAIAALPKHITMVYVDYDSKLSDDQVRKILQDHDVQAVEEEMQDGWCWEHECYQLDFHENDELKSALEAWHHAHDIDEDDDEWMPLSTFKDEFEGEMERFKEAIYDRDDSDTLAELIKNTDSVGLILRPKPNHAWTEDTTMQDIEALVRMYRLDSEEDRWKERLLESCHESIGYFQVVITAEPDDLIHFVMKESFESKDRIPDPMLRFDRAEISFDGYDLITASGQIPLTLNADELEWVIDSDHSYDSSYSIVSMLEDYKKGLVEFYQYRAKLMGAAS